MSIFRRDSAEPSPPSSSPAVAPARSAAPPVSRPRAPQQSTVIAPGTRVTGEISGGADLTVEGDFDGQIQLDSRVEVGSSGRVKGQIHAGSVRISGKVMGDVTGKDLVELTAEGALEGNVAAARVVIAEGAFFKGSVEMTGGSAGRAPSAGSGKVGSTGGGGKAAGGKPSAATSAGGGPSSPAAKGSDDAATGPAQRPGSEPPSGGKS